MYDWDQHLFFLFVYDNYTINKYIFQVVFYTTIQQVIVFILYKLHNNRRWDNDNSITIIITIIHKLKLQKLGKEQMRNTIKKHIRIKRYILN